MKRNLLPFIALMFLFALITGCHSTFSGQVLDAETGKPIEGAFVIGQWTITRGFGNTYTEVLAVNETFTDHDGKFKLVGSKNPSAHYPEVLIFKDGYTAWRSDYVFPSWEKRAYQNNVKINLERFKDEYSYTQYSFFLDHAFLSQHSPKLSEIVNNARLETSRRASIQIPVNFTGKIVDAETGMPIEGAFIMATGQGIGYTPKINTLVEAVSDKEGIVRIAGSFPMLENPPGVLVYYKGYFAQSNWHSGIWKIKELKEFKWTNSFVFKMEKWDPRFSHKDHYNFMENVAARAASEGKPQLMNLIMWEKDAK
jgi:hypothetical protein